jgi:soluble lytic murein transglycosylase-like protein
MKFPILALLLASPLFVCGLGVILHCFPTKGLSSSERPDLSLATQKMGIAIPSYNLLRPWHPPADRDRDIHIVQGSGNNPTGKVQPMKSSDVRALISAAAQRHRIPEAFLKSIVAVESNFDSAAVSPKGAIGLMQLMPTTAHQYGADPTIPEQNVDAGSRYLRCLIERYRKSRNPLTRVIAAYNAGPGAVDRYRGVPPFRETRGYVVRVLALLRRSEGGRELMPGHSSLAY